MQDAVLNGITERRGVAKLANGLVHISAIVARIAAGVSLADTDASFDASPSRKLRAKMHGEPLSADDVLEKVPENAS